eukprot:247296_1
MSMESTPYNGPAYNAMRISRHELEASYQGHAVMNVIHLTRNKRNVNNAFFNVCNQKAAVVDAVEYLSLSVPCHIIDFIMNLQLDETQLFIESKSKQLQTIIIKNGHIDPFPFFICRDIVLYCGGYCWDANFWAISNSNRPLHKYSHFDRVAFYCGNQDVIYCKADEYVNGPRYFATIDVVSKKDNMWLGVVWNNEHNWGRRRGQDKIAYHGGRFRSTVRLLAEFENKFPQIYDSLKHKKKLELELSCIQHQSELVERPHSLWDGAFGGIHGRGKIESLALPYYSSGDVIGILVDKTDGMIYFYKNDSLVWFIAAAEIKNTKCKIFGSTDTTNDTIIYSRILWNDRREQDLRRQVKELRETRPDIDKYSLHLPFE